MVYSLLGRVVWRVLKLFLRRRYGKAMLPKPVLAAGVLVLAVGALLALQRRDTSTS